MRLLKDYSYNPDMVRLVNLPELRKAAESIPALPCPFCGGDPAAELAIMYKNFIGVSVSCTACRIRTPLLQEGQTMAGTSYTLHERLQQAAKLWNSRT